MKNILISSAGQRVSLVRAFEKELNHFFPQSKVFTTDLNPELSAACNISQKFFKIRKVTDSRYIYDLLKICIENHVSMIVPTIDTELLPLAANKHIFEAEKIRVIVSEKNFVHICRDKRKTGSFFKEHLISIPETVSKLNPTFPLFIKPFDGSLSVDTFIIDRQEQLTEYHLRNERFLFMEYISKVEHDEYTVDMYYGRDNLVKCIVPRKRIWVRAGEVSKAVTSKNIIVSFLKEKLGKIQGAIGCLTVQVFLNKVNNKIIGIEINPRFGGGFPLSYLAGANYPKWLIQEYLLNQIISYSDNWEDQLLMLRYDDEVLVHDFKC